MPGTLILPGSVKPHNLNLARSATAKPLTSDMYDICNRIRDEVSSRLRIVELEHAETDTHAYAIMEDCDDGECRLVYKVKTGELDGRVIKRLQHMIRVPFAERLRAAEQENDRWEKEQHENSMDELYERIGRPMLTDLERCGFIDRSTSYAKTGHIGGRGSNRRERRAAAKRAA